MKIAMLLIFLSGIYWGTTSAQEPFSFRRPYGYYSIEGHHRGFENIDTIQHWQQERQWPDGSALLPGVNLVGGKRYRFAKVRIDSQHFIFITETLNGVRYRFTGKFLKANFEIPEIPEEWVPVVTGVIIKYRNGVKVARAKVTLSYFAGT